MRLDEVVLRSLAREPERRYQHASEVKTDLESISSMFSPQSAKSPFDPAEQSTLTSRPHVNVCNGLASGL